MRFFFPAVIAFLSVPVLAAQDAESLLERVAKNYRAFQSIEITGTLSAPVPDRELIVHIKSDFAIAPPSIVPLKKAAGKHFVARRVGSVTLTDANGQRQQAPVDLGPIAMPGDFGGDEKLNQDVTKVTELRGETLNLAEGPISCRVLQVEYHRPDWQPEERRIRYWIDETRLLVLKEEFSEFQRREHKTTLWHWVYEAESIKVNQSPANWVVESAKRSATRTEGRQLTNWIGKNAPEFTLTDLDNNSVRLSATKGEVVVLNFWATWCGPCMAEMPTLTKVANDYKRKGVVFWGISAEQPSTLRKWLTQNQTAFTIVLDKQGDVTEDYQTEGIPALVVIGRDGKIHSFYSGAQSEPSLRDAIDQALRE